MNKAIIVVLVVVVALLAVLSLILNYNPSAVNKNYDALFLEAQDLNARLSAANLRIIELQENEKYSRIELDKARASKRELELVYSDLWGDASTCFWANYCLYYEEECIDILGDIWEGYTAQEIHVVNSDMCDDMYRDWEKYQSYDFELNEGK